MKEQEYRQEVEIESLSEDYFSVEELEARLELATGLIDTLCVGNGCVSDSCAGNHDGGWW